jgi:hypothetical protein
MGQQNVEDRLCEILADADRRPSMTLLAPSRIAAAHPRLPLALIKDSTHGTSGAQPEAFNKAVLDFLGDVEAGRPVAGEVALSDRDLSSAASSADDTISRTADVSPSESPGPVA